MQRRSAITAAGILFACATAGAEPRDRAPFPAPIDAPHDLWYGAGRRTRSTLDDFPPPLRVRPMPPTVFIRALEVSGAIEPRLVRKALRRHQDELLACYERDLRDHPATRGTLALSFAIAPDGTARDVEATGLDDAVSRCVLEQAKTFTYPTPRGGAPVTVTAKLRFDPSS